MADQTPQAYFAEDAKISFEKKGSSPVDYTTSITNYSESGGTRDTDSIAHFGGAFITVKKPREEFEVSFDVDINDITFAEMMGGSVTEYGSETVGSALKVESHGVQNPYRIKIEWFDKEVAASLGSTAGSDAGAGFKILYYNAYGVEFTKDNTADDRLTGTIRFNLGPADKVGSGQKIEIECQDFGGDGSPSGSWIYGSWEEDLDTQFGY